MAEEVYGFCKSKCKHKIFTQNDYAVVSGKIKLKYYSNLGISHATIGVDYPEGFTRNNCFVIGRALNVSPSSSGWDWKTGTSVFKPPTLVTQTSENSEQYGVMVTLNISCIEIGAIIQGSLIASGYDNQEVEYELLLMKYDD